MGLCSRSQDRIPQQAVHSPLCFVAPSSGERVRQKEKQDLPEYICAGLTLAVAVFYLFWLSLRQFHFSISVGEHPRLTLSHRVLRNTPWKSPVQASASKAPQAPIRGTQLPIGMSSNSFMPHSRDDLPSVLSWEGAEVRWNGFYKQRGTFLL